MAKPCLSNWKGNTLMVHPEERRLSLYRESWAGVPVEWHFCSVGPRRGRWKAVLELKPALLLLFETFTNLMWPIGKKAAKSQLSIKLNRIKRKGKFRDNMNMYCPWNITKRDKNKLTMVSTCWLSIELSRGPKELSRMVYRNPYDGYSEEGGGYSCQEEYAGCREPDSQYYTHQAQVSESKMDWNCCLLIENGLCVKAIWRRVYFWAH